MEGERLALHMIHYYLADACLTNSRALSEEKILELAEHLG